MLTGVQEGEASKYRAVRAAWSCGAIVDRAGGEHEMVIAGLAVIEGGLAPVSRRVSDRLDVRIWQASKSSSSRSRPSCSPSDGR